jgi:hypothetical protein
MFEAHCGKNKKIQIDLAPVEKLTFPQRLKSAIMGPVLEIQVIQPLPKFKLVAVYYNCPSNSDLSHLSFYDIDSKGGKCGSLTLKEIRNEVLDLLGEKIK